MLILRLLLLGCITLLASNSGLLLHTEYCFQSVCLLVTIVSPAEMSERIEMLFGGLSWVGQGTMY